MFGRRTVSLLGVSVLTLCSAALSSTPARAATATANLTSGGLTFITVPSSPTFSITLTGVDQTPASQPMTFDVGDATGSGVGWNLTAQQTAFTGPHPFPNVGMAGSPRPAATCDGGGACAVAQPPAAGPISYPVAFTVASTTKIYQADAGTGMGNQSVTVQVGLGTVLASQFAGAYTSTWTFTLVSTP